MKISYKWLKQFLDVDLTADQAAEYLTDSGLEVEGVEEFQTVKGGLEGLVIGEVKSKEKHPDADRLSLCKVDVGAEELLDIVCGAPNVDTGQKVVVAQVNAMLYPSEGEPFKIKKSKIRGQASEGMICAEDEIGLGESHDGIMLLDANAKVGTPASAYFKVENDSIFEIGLTPNRTDGMSHYGVARDLLAVLQNTQEAYDETTLELPKVDSFKVDNHDLEIAIEVKDYEACPRYAGVTINNVEVKESPDWLKNRLKAIGQKPINNVVDITNYVLHDLGQPLHAFDAAKITRGKVVVKKLAQDSTFVTLDEVERKLDANDLMICNAEGGMCIAGVFGGIHSGVTESTKSVFLESAYFDPVHVRKTAKRHGLNTDASFRFERGIDPNTVVYALKRAALLIQELAGGSISSEIIDLYPKPIANREVEINYTRVNSLIGKEIEVERIKKILTSLDIEIVDESEEGLKLSVPPYRQDVTREADVIEEILRIYGYNNISFTDKINTSISYSEKPNRERLRNVVSDLLTANGFAEIMSNSLTKSAYYEDLTSLKPAHNVEMLNPLSSDLNVLRQSMLFNGLEALAHNINRKQEDLKLYEFGSTYHKYGGDALDKYNERSHFSVFITGKRHPETWISPEQKSSFYTLKGAVELLLQRLGIKSWKLSESVAEDLFQSGLKYDLGKMPLVEMGTVSQKQLKKLGIDQEVFYADIHWDTILKVVSKKDISFKPLSQFPEVRRDLALLLDKSVKYAELEKVAQETERKLLNSVNLFDVYEGKNLPEGKKSYALSFTLQNEQKTLTDKEINKVMDKLTRAYKEKFAAELR